MALFYSRYELSLNLLGNKDIITRNIPTIPETTHDTSAKKTKSTEKYPISINTNPNKTQNQKVNNHLALNPTSCNLRAVKVKPGINIAIDQTQYKNPTKGTLANKLKTKFTNNTNNTANQYSLRCAVPLISAYFVQKRVIAVLKSTIFCCVVFFTTFFFTGIFSPFVQDRFIVSQFTNKIKAPFGAL